MIEHFHGHLPVDRRRWVSEKGGGCLPLTMPELGSLIGMCITRVNLLVGLIGRKRQKKPGLLLAGLWRDITLTFCPRRRLVTPEWRFPGFWRFLLSPTLHRLIMSRSVIRHGRIRRSLTSYSGGTAPDLHRLPLPVPEIRDVLRPYSVVKYAWLAKGSVDLI